jgi:hypothetical protein
MPGRLIEYAPTTDALFNEQEASCALDNGGYG